MPKDEMQEAANVIEREMLQLAKTGETIRSLKESTCLTQRGRETRHEKIEIAGSST